MGLKLTKRVFRDDKCVGYYVTDGRKTLPMNIVDVQNYVMQNRIDNVRAKSTVNGIVLYGVDGFRIEDLPVEKQVTKPKKDIEVEAIHKRDGVIIGYTVKCNGVSAKVNIDIFNKYMQAGRVYESSLKTAKIVETNTVKKVDLAKVYSEYDLRGEAKRYVAILRALETGDKTEENKIVSIINRIESFAKESSKTEAEFRELVEKAIKMIRDGADDKTKIYMRNSRNDLQATLSSMTEEIKALPMDTTSKNIVTNFMSVVSDTKELSKYSDFEGFRKHISGIHKKIGNIRSCIDNARELQASKDRRTEQIMENARRKIEALNPNDELRSEKALIYKEPWSYKNDKFLEGTDHFKDIFITAKDESKRYFLRMMDISWKETFNPETHRRTGFDAVYNGKKYHYAQVMNNINMLAAFIKIAEDNDYIGMGDMGIKVRIGSEIREITLGVGNR